MEKFKIWNTGVIVIAVENGEEIEYYIQIRYNRHRISDFKFVVGVNADDKFTKADIEDLYMNGYFDNWIDEINEENHFEV